MEFESVIGLEIHVQLKTDTKIFCGCKSKFGDSPNTHTCPVCLGLPGSLPVLNRKVVEMGILAGLATNCTITKKSIFARKNYFYPDLTKGYQISQYDQPLCENGFLHVGINGKSNKISITRIHLEEDAGKLIHDQDVDTLFDANRCGTPLIEIVTEPDIRSSKEAYIFLTGLKQILKYLEVSDCNMEEASLRCDANISIRCKGETELGTKTELKNMNSFKGVEKALEYEFHRQKDILESGGKIIQQTFLWDASRNITLPMRTKEEAHDYRYFPEPDLVPLIVNNSLIENVKKKLPELPQKRCERFISQYNLTEEHARILTDERSVADYYEKTAACYNNYKMAANWVMGESLRICKEKKTDIHDINLTPERLASILKSVIEGVISANAGKKIINKVEKENREPSGLIEEMGLKQVSDTSELEKIVRKILDSNPEETKRYKQGENKLRGFFMGQAMKATKGKGNPQEINRILSEMTGYSYDK